MLNLLLKQICGLFNQKPISQEIPAVSSNEDEKEVEVEVEFEEFSDNLDTACATITIYIREDGEFAITSEFFDDTKDVAEISGTVLHMLNSGILADYFLQSLNLWGDENEQQHAFVLQIIQKWKNMFDSNEIESMQNNTESSYKLAIDPSDVFGLKGLSKGQ
jgi:hypothetical protein